LHFAEVFFTNAGSRNFSVYIEDELFTIEITDGEANIRFESHTENAQVSAIRISSVGEAGPVVDLAAGGAVYDANCAFCHGESGVQVPIGGADIDILIPLQESHVHLTAPDEPLDLVTYIDRYMFTFYPEAGCDDECLANLTAYIGSLDANYVPPEVIASCGDIEVGYGRRQMRLLQAKEYENTIADLFNVVVDASSAGVPVDTYVEGFANQVLTLVSESYANGYALLAGQIAEASADQNFAGVANCTGTVAECGEIFVDDFAYKVFRRPLTDEEKGRYLTLFDSAGSVEEGLTLAIETILGSPNFLYRSEAGQLVGDIVNPTAEEEALDDDSYVLTQYELATLLAYTYTGSTPDDELLTAAENNELRTAVDLQEQVDRLLELPEAREHFREFAKQWLSTDRIISVNKDDSFTSFTSDVRSSMSEEVLQIVSHVMFDDLSVSDFYSNFSFIDQTLADFYGIAGNFSDEFVKVEGLVDRGGILTSGAFMAGYATAVESSPIIRACLLYRII